jgi:hypothetical protein
MNSGEPLGDPSVWGFEVFLIVSQSKFGFGCTRRKRERAEYRTGKK